MARSRRKNTVTRDRSRSSVTTMRIGSVSFFVHARILAAATVDYDHAMPARGPITPDDVARAAATIRGTTHRTPTFSSRSLGPGRHLKAELFQRTGSFKARGALNRVRAALGRGARAWCDQRLGRQPRPGARMGRSHRGGRRAPRHVGGGEQREDRRHAWVRRHGRPRGGRPGCGVRAPARAAGADGAGARPSVQRSGRHRRRGDGRARDPRGRARGRHDRRCVRRGWPRHRDRGGMRAARRSRGRRRARALERARARARGGRARGGDAEDDRRCAHRAVRGHGRDRGVRQARRRGRARHRRRDPDRRSGSSTSVPSSPPSRGRQPRSPPCWPGRSRGDSVVAVVSGGNVSTDIASAILAGR